MSKIYVYSTLANDQEYAGWSDGQNNLKRVHRSVMIKGGANLANKHLITPLGVVTEITPEDEAFLRQNKIFQIHEKNGFIRIDTEKMDVEKAVSDMEHREPSSPDVPQDFVEIEDPELKGVRKNKRAR